MDRQQIVAKVVQTVTQIQEVSGRSSAGIGASTRPVQDVEGFDSLCAVEATILLSESLGVALPDDYNPFISDDGERALSVGEMADTLGTYVGSEA